jgi:hypothetical protein
VLAWLCRLFRTPATHPPSSGQRRWCAGIVRAFDFTGTGNRVDGRNVRSYKRRFRQLIREMSIANRCEERHGFMASCSSLGSILGRPVSPNTWRGGAGAPSQGWKTFLRNHAAASAMDLFVVPTISFQLLYGLLIMGHTAGDLDVM